MLTFDPYIPLALWFPLLLAAVAALIVYGLNSRGRIPQGRRLSVLLLMAVAVILPLCVLLNPTWVERLPPPAGKPILTVIIDRSASMATADVEGETSRHDESVKIASTMMKQLAERFEIQFRSFDETGQVTDFTQIGKETADGATTNLAAAIEDSLDEWPQGQALLLLSDGVHNAGGGASKVRRSVEKARAMAVPIYTKTIGSESGVKDLEVSLNRPQEMAFAGQNLPVAVSIRQRGLVTDKAKLSLVLDDQVVETQDIGLAAAETTLATFQVLQADKGLYRYEVRVDDHLSEVTNVNNAATLLVRVVDEPVRVLVLEGKPYWDTKFLLRTLSSDRSIELTSIVRMAGDRFLQRDVSRSDVQNTKEMGESSSDPQPSAHLETWKIHTGGSDLFNDENNLDVYQIIVLGRDAEVFLDDTMLGKLKKWLTEGSGSLVCVRGPPSSQVGQRLGELMPVRWSPARETRFRIQLTESGQSLHWLPTAGDDDVLAKLPSLAAVTQPERPKPLAVVLARVTGTENADPVISYQPIGGGRVVVVEGAGMWRWAFLPVEHQEYDEVYGMLWRSLVRWLVSNSSLLPSQHYLLRSDKVTFGTAELATATLLMHVNEAADVPKIELTGDALKQPQQITPIPAGTSSGQFRVVFGPLAEGRYRAHVVGADADEATAIVAFDVRGSLAERLDVAARPDLMKLIADESGGAVLTSADPDELSQKFTEHLSASFPERLLRVTAWDRWWVLVAIVALWASSWGLRRRTGLV
ncbi:MAG: CARDB domain-containing protein [Planctomycetaceae bacterium]